MEASNAAYERRSLEQLLEAGEVECALILPAGLTDRELEIARQAFEQGVKLGKKVRDADA